MADRIPSFFILVPGPWRDPTQLVAALTSLDIPAASARASPIGRNELRIDIVESGDVATGFRWGRGGAQPPAFLERIARCDRAALIEFVVSRGGRRSRASWDASTTEDREETP